MAKSSLLLQEPTLQVLPSLAVAIGLDNAIVVQQLHFLLTNQANGRMLEDGERYIFNTYEQWQKHFKWWNERTIQRIFLALEKRGLVVAKQPEGVMSRRKYYRISQGAMEKLTYQQLAETMADQPKSHDEGAKSGCSGSSEFGTIEDAKIGCSSYRDNISKKTTEIHTGESPIRDECVDALASLECKILSEVTDWPKHRVAAAKMRKVCPNLTPGMIFNRAANYRLNFSVPVTSTGLAKHWGLCGAAPDKKLNAAVPLERPKQPARPGNIAKEDYATWGAWTNYVKACRNAGFEPEEMR